MYHGPFHGPLGLSRFVHLLHGQGHCLHPIDQHGEYTSIEDLPFQIILRPIIQIILDILRPLKTNTVLTYPKVLAQHPQVVLQLGYGRLTALLIRL